MIAARSRAEQPAGSAASNPDIVASRRARSEIDRTDQRDQHAPSEMRPRPQPRGEHRQGRIMPRLDHHGVIGADHLGRRELVGFMHGESQRPQRRGLTVTPVTDEQNRTLSHGHSNLLSHIRNGRARDVRMDADAR